MTETPQSRYDKKNRIVYSINLNRKTDSDVLNWLDQQPKKQTAIKELIREKIKSDSQK